METTIEWTQTAGPGGIIYPGYSFNPWWGCMKVSPACKNCYAETFAERFSPGLWGPAATTHRKPASRGYWQQPYKWNKRALALETRLKVFCASMADVFEDHPEVLTGRKQLWDLITYTPYLDWLLLTKRPENVLAMIPETWRGALPANVWVGTSVENQDYANIRIPELLKIPARVRFLSCEPLQGPIEFSDVTKRPDYLLQLGKQAFRGFSWVIAGGESGPNATPSHPAWFRSLRDQCQAAGVPFFFKQWGEFNGEGIRMGKNGAGNLLDGKKYLEMPI